MEELTITIDDTKVTIKGCYTNDDHYGEDFDIRESDSDVYTPEILERDHMAEILETIAFEREEFKFYKILDEAGI